MPKQLLLLWAEFILLFGGVPLIAMEAPRSLKFSILWLLALYGVAKLRHIPGMTVRKEWNWRAGWQDMKSVLPRTLFGCAALTMMLLVMVPERLLMFPLERPQVWAMVMIWYPILSVLPQELIYRSLFFYRYAKLFKKENTQIIVSGVMFGWGHIMFMHWVPVLLTTIGGILFSHTYLKHRSLAAAWLEHTVYGCFLFTIGLGWFFYGVNFKPA